MIKYLKNIKLFLVLAAVALSVAACGSTPEETTPVITMQPVVPHSNVQKQKLYTYLLDEQGINIIKIGETRTVVIAADALFTPGSANFNAAYAKNLKVIAQLINSYDTTNVAVNAYGDKPGDVARSLTAKQAQKVLAYLKKYGVDTRLIYAEGYGNLYPVALSVKDQQLNRRIEIKFQFYPEKKV